MEICVIKDIKAGVYHKPFAIDNRVSAEREFRGVILGKHGDSILTQYPEDFELLTIAKFDEITGKLVIVDETVIVKGKDVKFWNENKEDKDDKD